MPQFDLTMPQNQRDACRMIVGRCLFRMMVGADPSLPTGPVTEPMFHWLVDRGGLAPGLEVTETGEEIPAFQVWDPDQALAAVNAVPLPSSGLLLPGRA